MQDEVTCAQGYRASSKFSATATEPSSIEWPIDSSMPRSIDSVEFELVLPAERENSRDLAVYRWCFDAPSRFFWRRSGLFSNAGIWLCLRYCLVGLFGLGEDWTRLCATDNRCRIQVN
jgi:hypothetical protein